MSVKRSAIVPTGGTRLTAPEPHIRAMFVGDFSAVVLAAVRAQE
jgi:hypothetical protein